jgi:hypothetical protein
VLDIKVPQKRSYINVVRLDSTFTSVFDDLHICQEIIQIIRAIFKIFAFHYITPDIN